VTDLNHLIGYITAVQSSTRESGTVVGNSMKTILSRITTIEDAGKSLKTVGIDIKDMTGSVRKTDDILGDLAKSWNFLTDSQKQNIAINVAGRQHITRFLALMDNWKIVTDATATSQHAQGSAMRENARYMDSMEAKLNSLKTSWQELSLAMGKAVMNDAFFGVTSILQGMSQGAIFLVSKFGLLPSVIGLVAISFILLNKKLQESILSTGRYSLAIENLKRAENGLAINNTRLATSIETKNVAMRGVYATVGRTEMAFRGLGSVIAGAGRSLMALAPEIAIVTGLGWAIEKLIGAFGKWSEEKAKDERENKALSEAYRSHGKDISDLINQYDELNSRTGLSSEKEQEKLDIANKLSALMPSLVKHTTDDGQAHLFTVEQMKKQLELAKQIAEVESKKKAKQKDSDTGDDIKAYNTKANQLEEMKKKVEELKANIENQRTLGNTELVNAGEIELLEWEAKLMKLESATAKAKDTVSNDIRDLVNKSVKELGNFKAPKSIEESIKNMFTDGKVTGQMLSDYRGFVSQMTTASQKLQDALNMKIKGDEGTAEFNKSMKDRQTAIRQATSDLMGLHESYGVSVSDIWALTDSVKKQNDEVKNTGDGIVHYNSSLDELDTITTTTSQNIELITNAIAEYNATQKLSKKTVDDIIQQYPQLEKYQNNEKQLVKEITKLRDGEAEAERRAFNLKLAYNNNYIKNLASLYGVEINNWKNKAQAQLQIENSLIQALGTNWNKFFNANQDKLTEQGRYAMKLAKIGAEDGSKSAQGFIGGINGVLTGQYKQALDLVDQIQYTTANFIKPATQSYETKPTKTSKPKKSSSSSSDKDPTKLNQTANQVAIDRLNSEIAVIEKKNELLDKGSKAYRDNLLVIIAKEKELQKRYTTEQNDIQKKINSDNSKIKSFEKGGVSKKELDSYNKLKNEVADLTKKLGEAKVNLQDTTNDIAKNYASINESLIAGINSLLDSTVQKYNNISDMLSKLDKDISVAQAYDKDGSSTSTVIAKEQEKIKLLKIQQGLVAQDIATLQKSLNSNKNNKVITEQVNALLKEKLALQDDVNVALAQERKNLNDIRSDIADKIIEAEKKYYEQKRDSELKAIDDSIEAYEKEYTIKMKGYDDQLKAIDDIYNAQLKSIRDTKDKDDYNRNLQKSQDEAQAIQNKINALSLDDSMEAKAKKEELAKQLADKQMEIEDMVREHNYQLQENAINDSKDADEKALQGKKDALDKEKDEFEQSQDDKRKAIEKMYDDILNNELFWKQKHDNIVQGALSDDISKMQEFVKDVQGHMENLGTVIQNNLVANLTDAFNLLKQISDIPLPSLSDYTDSDYTHSQIKDNVVSAKDRGGTINKSAYVSLDTGGHTGNFDGGKLALLHEKELVLNKMDTSNILTVVSMVRDLFSGKATQNNNPSSSDNRPIQIIIDKMYGTQKDIDNTLDLMEKGLKSRGLVK
jgi:hypothetical protein